MPSSRNQPAISCWMSYSVVGVPRRTRSAMAVERAILDPVEALGRRAVRRDRLARPSTPRTAARDRPTTRLPRRAHGCSRPCRRPRAPDRESRPPASTPSRARRMPCEQRVEPGGERFAACVHRACRRAACRDCALDGVHELPRLAGGGNHVVPPARGHLAAAGQAGQASRNRDSSRGSRRAAIRRVRRRRAPTARRRCRGA